MRILQVRFKNLNSLAGEWAIDFTHPAYVNDGIFAITGPTGAGKSTILDAISLALYGRTPRLDRISKNANEIMSRRTGECRAEVTFETQKGRYRCVWSQHRARKKADGDLQPPSHEIADADSGEILEEKMRFVQDRVVEATGMDFDRFCRSMLLAQGGFAAFLQAAPAERSPILEQITGTEIYSEISTAVHERNRDEQATLDRMRAELAGLVMLGPEEEEALRAGLTANQQRETMLADALREKTNAIAWLDGIARLREEAVELERQAEAVRLEEEAFSPRRDRLVLARRALELDGEFSALEAGRVEADRTREQIRELETRLPKCEQRVAETKEAHEKTRARADERVRERDTALPVLRQARLLDARLAEKEKPLVQLRDSLENVSRQVADMDRRLRDDAALLDEKRVLLKTIRDRQQANAGDERLRTMLPVMLTRLESLQTLREQKHQSRELMVQCRHHAQAMREQAHKHKANAAAKQEEHAILENALQILTARRDQLLGDRSDADWRALSLQHRENKESLARALEQLGAAVEREGMIANLAAQEADRIDSLTAMTRERDNAVQRYEKQKETVRLLAENQALLAAVRSLEDHRRTLRDGEPCALCGSLDHPYTRGHIPAADDAEQKLAAARTEADTLGQVVRELEITAARLDKELAALRERMSFLRQEKRDMLTRVSVLCDRLGIDRAFGAMEDRLRALLDNNEILARQTADTMEKADAVRMEIDAMRSRVEAALAEFTRAERETLTAENAATLAEREIARLEREETESEKRIASDLEALDAMAKETCGTAFTLKNARHLYEQLCSRRDAWEDNDATRHRLEREIATLEGHAKTNEKLLADKTAECERQRARLEELTRDYDGAVRERQAVSAEQDIDAAEQRVALATTKAVQEAETCRRQFDAASAELEQNRYSIEQLRRTVESRNREIENAAAAFSARLGEKGFDDEASYRAARLEEEERAALECEAARLASEGERLRAVRDEKANLLRSEEEKAVTAEEPAALRDAVAALTADQRVLQQEIGVAIRRLQDNEEARRRHGDRAREVEAQERECARWRTLDKLIGSRDGGKYRTFAQGLTFDIMIRHANLQLQKMSDRYLLIRDSREPLELQVIDSYQDDLPRSTRNLSGGESFLISLALALGLSGMASRNVRVESLFLDEGFGTLDQEALDIALDTLSGLHREGRLIGAISHVPALRERIGVHIEVMPVSGGVSRIDGPGIAEVK